QAPPRVATPSARRSAEQVRRPLQPLHCPPVQRTGSPLAPRRSERSPAMVHQSDRTPAGPRETHRRAGALEPLRWPPSSTRSTVRPRAAAPLVRWPQRRQRLPRPVAPLMLARGQRRHKPPPRAVKVRRIRDQPGIPIRMRRARRFLGSTGPEWQYRPGRETTRIEAGNWCTAVLLRPKTTPCAQVHGRRGVYLATAEKALTAGDFG